MKKNILLFFVFSVLIGFFSCTKDESDRFDDTIKITNDITSPTVWSGNKVYVIKKKDFYVDNTLRIEAGAIIKFPEGNGISLGNSPTKQGRIIAHGNSSNPIIFTSLKDDEHGGDTNEDGASTKPSEKDWGPIDLNGTNGSEFIYCNFLYGGYGFIQRGTLLLTSKADALIENCKFIKSGGGKEGNFYYGALNASNASNNTIIKNNLFYDNEVPLSIFAEINIDNSNVFSFEDKSNKFNGIFVSGNIENNTYWEETEVAFVITNENTIIKNDISLTLGDNVVLKFPYSQSVLTLLGGDKSLKNYNGSGVFYTSFKDDELKGDTNGDGSATTPAEADWKGIFIDDWKSVGFADWDNILYNDPNAVVK